MSRRLAAAACLLLLAAGISGCWVVEEINKGSKLMDDHSAKGSKEEAEKKAKPGEAKPGVGLDAYFKAQEAEGKTKTFTPGQVSEGIVACKLGGKTQFMTTEACAARGGRS